MKDKLNNLLQHPFSVIVVMVIATLLSYADRNYGYFFGVGICLFLLWNRNWKWSDFGFGQKLNWRTVKNALLLTVLIVIGINICIEPFLELYFGRINLSSLDDIRGNFVGYAFIMVVVWVFAAFGEELLFRGYYMKRLAELIGDTDKAWLMAAVLISVYFGVSHNYQGTSGMIAVGLVGFCQAIIFYKNRQNLMLGVLVHGFYDTIGVTLIYFNQERIFADWIEKIVLG